MVPVTFVGLESGRTSCTLPAFRAAMTGAACPSAWPAFWFAMAQMAVKMRLAKLVPPQPASTSCCVPLVSTMGAPVLAIVVPPSCRRRHVSRRRGRRRSVPLQRASNEALGLGPRTIGCTSAGSRSPTRGIFYYLRIAVRLDSHHQLFVRLSRTGYVPIPVIPTECPYELAPRFSSGGNTP